MVINCVRKSCLPAALPLVALLLTACGSPVQPDPQNEPQQPVQSESNVPTDGYGNPDFNGIWQSLGAAHWDLEAHAARGGPVVELGALGAIPAGLSVVIGGEIPYQPWAREQQLENRADWLARDPAVKCFLPGVPRATYMPHPFQIVQGSDHILISYEFAGASRVVYLDRPDFEHPMEAWMGHSRGRFEGDSLVIDVDSHMADTWLDSAGNFHSDELRVVEQFSHVGPDVLMYEAEITDPKVFERPWTIRMPLYRRLEENAQLLEFKCVEFAEELMYGHLRKAAETTD
jgi:hypothetical protein